jgi:uncharacterized protein YhjY with autotransporter beta-barrel domain
MFNTENNIVQTKPALIIHRAAALMALAALLPTLALSQQTIVLPVLPGQSPLQTAIGTAVATMCVNALDGHSAELTPQQTDLHVQCHAIAGAVITSSGSGSGASSALGALSQVSGNEISTQGALATRAVSGQFANISGRLTALRFGGNLAVSQGRVVDNNEDQSSPFATLAALASPQNFFRGQATSDWNSADNSQVGLIKAAYTTYTDEAPMLAQNTSSGSRSPAISAPTAPNPWGTFLQGSYTTGHHDATSNEDPFHFHAASVTGGIDYNFGSAVLGGSIGYDDYDASFRSSGATVSGGDAEVKSTSASLYGAWFGEHWTFNGIATYGKLTTSVSRIVNYTVTYDTSKFADPQPDIKDNCVGTLCTVSVNRTLEGNPDGHTIAMGATGGYQFSSHSLDIFPSVSVNYRRSSIGSFNEGDPNPPAGGDGLALAFGDQTVDSLRSILGLDLSHPISLPFGVLTPLFRVEWDHEYKTSVRSIAAHYVFDPTATTTCLSCFALPADASPANYGVVGIGLSATLAHRIQAFLFDEALVGYDNYHSNSVALGVRAQF